MLKIEQRMRKSLQTKNEGTTAGLLVICLYSSFIDILICYHIY